MGIGVGMLSHPLPLSLALLPHPIPGTHWSGLCTKFLHQTSKGEFASSLDPSLIL